jgi:two-component system, chemotaxis family, CheB/CheR fusion protein
VRSATGVDFTHYKHSTLARRIKRRMALRGFETLEDYSRDLEQNREEANALCETALSPSLHSFGNQRSSRN